MPVSLMTQLPQSAVKKLASQQIELARYLDDLSASVNDFEWRLDTSDKSNPRLVGSTVLVKFKLPKGNINHLLNRLDFNDPKMISSSH